MYVCIYRYDIYEIEQDVRYICRYTGNIYAECAHISTVCVGMKVCRCVLGLTHLEGKANVCEGKELFVLVFMCVKEKRLRVNTHPDNPKHPNNPKQP